MDNHSLMRVRLTREEQGLQCAICGATFEYQDDLYRPCSQPDMPTDWAGWRPSVGPADMPALFPDLRADAGQAVPRTVTHPGEAVSMAATQMTAALDVLEAALVAGEMGISHYNRTDLEMLRPRLWRAARMWPGDQAGGSGE